VGERDVESVMVMDFRSLVRNARIAELQPSARQGRDVLQVRDVELNFAVENR
jgi:hypothetical protein